MRLVQDHEQLPNPNVCFICETTPVRGATAVVDTERNFDPPALTLLSGRKLLCESCVADAALLLGFERGSAVRDAKVQLEQARGMLGDLKEQLRQVASFATDLSTSAVEIPTVSEPTPPVGGVATSETEHDATLTSVQRENDGGEA